MPSLIAVLFVCIVCLLLGYPDLGLVIALGFPASVVVIGFVFLLMAWDRGPRDD